MSENDYATEILHFRQQQNWLKKKTNKMIENQRIIQL